MGSPRRIPCFRPPLRCGPLEDMFRPILRGTLVYVGFDALQPFVAWHVPYISDEARQQFLVDYDQRLQQLSDDPPLVFPKLSQFDGLLTIV